MVYNQLLDGFRSIWDQEYGAYISMPSSYEEVSKKWGDVFLKYYQSMYSPISGNANPILLLAISNFENNLLNIIKNNIFKEKLADTIQILHFSIIEGVNLTNMWTTNYPIKLDLNECFLTGDYNEKAFVVCQKLANKIDLWVHTTTSINNDSNILMYWN